MKIIIDAMGGDNAPLEIIKGTMLAVCGEEAVKQGANAGRIVRETAALIGGKGGGRPDSASAGGKDASKLDEALAQVKTLLA